MALNVLIVDDSKLIPAMITQSLEMAQIEVDQVYTAKNGKEGLAILETEPVDLIFSDIHMPEMDGVEMIEQIRLDERTNSIPIIVISSERMQHRIDYLYELGVTCFLRKPFTPEMITEVIHEVVG